MQYTCVVTIPVLQPASEAVFFFNVFKSQPSLCDRLVARKPSANHATRNASRQIRRTKRATSQVGSLAELVTARKGKCVHNRKDKRNDCSKEKKGGTN